MFDNQSWQICIIMQETLFINELSFIVLGQHSFTAGSCWLFTGCSCFWICGSSSFAISLVGNKFHIFHHWLFFFRWKKTTTQTIRKKETFLDKTDGGRTVIPVKDFDQFCPNCSLRDSLLLTTHCKTISHTSIFSTLTSVYIFSILFSIHFLRCRQREFV